MTPDLKTAAAIRNAIDTVEDSYEFMLAYAAQGRKSEAGESGGESQIRQYLRRMAEALNILSDTVATGLGGPEAIGFDQRVAQDIEAVSAVIAILMSKPSISSEMIDNTNGLIVMRSFLTDLFFIDQVALPPRQAPAG